MFAQTQLDKSEIDRLNRQALLCLISNRQEARRLVDLALAASQAIDYVRGAAYAQINLVSLLLYAGDHEQAQQIAAPLPACFHALGDLEGEMSAESGLGALSGRRGDLLQSAHHFDNARNLAGQIPDSLHKFSLYNRLGHDAFTRGDTGAGPRYFLLALDMAERFGTPLHRVNILSNLASCQHDLGNDEDAIPLLVEALDILGRNQAPHLRRLVSANLAMSLLSTGKTEQALHLVEPYYETSDAPLAEKAFIFCLAAHASILLDQHRNAEALLAQAQAMADACGDYEEQMHAWLVRGMLELARNHTGQALAALNKAQDLLSYTRNPFYLLQILKGLANLYSRLGKWKNAYSYLEQYQVNFEAISKSARDSRLLMRNLEHEMKSLKEERDNALELQAAREAENQKLESLNKELAHQIHHVNLIQSKLKEQAIRDHLTGLYNRRHFETCLNAILHEASGQLTIATIAVVIIDLDLFKQVNDTYGHACGDEVLTQFARLVESNLRDSDLLCRYGGEEFCLLLRGINAPMAAARIDHIAAKYRELVIEHGGHRLSGNTFSAGIAIYPQHGTSRHELLMRADTALYAAKMAGRSQSSVAQDG